MKKLKEYNISVIVYATNDKEAFKKLDKGEWESPEIQDVNECEE
jgi:hypothetical protein